MKVALDWLAIVIIACATFFGIVYLANKWLIWTSLGAAVICVMASVIWLLMRDENNELFK